MIKERVCVCVFVIGLGRKRKFTRENEDKRIHCDRSVLIVRRRREKH